jgi:hypothetical protein
VNRPEWAEDQFAFTNDLVREKARTISTGPLQDTETQAGPVTVIDVRKWAMAMMFGRRFALALCLAGLGTGLAAAGQDGPPVSKGFFPLSEVKRGMMATAWTVFTGTKPEPMQVEILGVLRGGRGPGHDMILGQLHGTKPEYTGVVAGMSGSPVYVGDRLLGSLSYRIGQFSKDPIAGITPIEQMLEVKDLPENAAVRPSNKDIAIVGHPDSLPQSSETMMQAMETPLVMSGFHPEAVRLWQERMKGTGLDLVAAGGMGSGSSAPEMYRAEAAASIEPGEAVSAQLVRGDVEIAATCTVTYVDAKNLLACGHPLQQLGPVSLPMTETEVVATLASPLNAFKIVNTGREIGAFTEDRDSAIKGVFGAKAKMIPVEVAIRSANGANKPRMVRFEVLDQPLLTAQAVLVSLYNSLLDSNDTTTETSYHVTGRIEMDGAVPGLDSALSSAQDSGMSFAPVDVWASGGDGQPAPLMAALGAAEEFNRFYTNNGRQGAMHAVKLDVEVIPRRVSVQLESARIISSNIVHAGDTVTIEATVRPWQQPARNVRIPIRLPNRLQPGSLRVLISDAATLDRTLDPPRLTAKQSSMEAMLAQARSQHAADRIYVSLLAPETQAGLSGETLTSLPLSMANALETLKAGQEATLNGETAIMASDAPAGGTLNGFQVLTLLVEAGGGVH